MLEWLRNNSAVIPFAVAALCNLWVSIDTYVNKKDLPMAITFLAYTLASSSLCWNYLVSGNK